MQDQIKGNLTGLMLSTPPVVRAQLSEALAVVSRHDFPACWPSLLPDLVHKLQQGGPGVLHGVLETANSIFKRYRDQYMSPALSRELELCEHFVQPLLDALTSVVHQLGAADQGDGAAVRQLLLTARLALRIFFSMNSPGLTPVRPSASAAWRLAQRAQQQRLQQHPLRSRGQRIALGCTSASCMLLHPTFRPHQRGCMGTRMHA